MSTTTTFRATDNVEVSDHARENWHERFWGDRDEPPVPVEVAWREARQHPVEWDRFSAVFVRMHPDTTALLFARRWLGPTGARTVVVTAMPAVWRTEYPSVRETLREVQ